jgi:death on curing protein
MSEPRWIDRRALELLHLESLAEHGGAPGLRDGNLLESALARPLNLHAYENVTDLPHLAAAYAFGVARNHPFVDGNKRAAFIAAGLFLALNGLRLTATPIDAYEKVLALATGEIDELAFADWIRGACHPR